MAKPDAEIKKALLDEYDTNKLDFIRENFNNLGAVSYEGLAIDVKQCPNHPFEYYIKIEGMGERLEMMYWVLEGELTMQEFLTNAYVDFCNYIIINRNEDTHESIH